MKKAIVFVLLLSFFSGVFAQVKEVNDPNAELRNVKGYHAIRISGGIDLFLSQSETEAVAVSASKEEYRQRIKTEDENGVLKIYYHNDGKWFRGDKKLKAYVSFRTLDKLHAEGASDVRVTGTIKATDLDIKMSGASDFEVVVQANSLVIDLVGASDMTIKGSATNMKIEASGATDFKGNDFQTDNCSARASGASDIHVTVNKELSAHASGASGVYYKGNGVIRDIKTNGASNVSKKS